jgi:hypothetical protein
MRIKICSAGFYAVNKIIRIHTPIICDTSVFLTDTTVKTPKRD